MTLVRVVYSRRYIFSSFECWLLFFGSLYNAIPCIRPSQNLSFSRSSWNVVRRIHNKVLVLLCILFLHMFLDEPNLAEIHISSISAVLSRKFPILCYTSGSPCNVNFETCSCFFKILERIFAFFFTVSPWTKSKHLNMTDIWLLNLKFPVYWSSTRGIIFIFFSSTKGKIF